MLRYPQAMVSRLFSARGYYEESWSLIKHAHTAIYLIDISY